MMTLAPHSLRIRTCLAVTGLVFCLALFCGCETLKPVEPTPAPAAAEQGQPPKAPAKKSAPHKSELKGLAKNMGGRGGKLPNVKPPDAKPSATTTPTTSAAPPRRTAETPIPPEIDTAQAANINDILEKNPIDEKADIQLTTVGKISTGRVQLMQANADIKPHCHNLHDEIIYIVKGKGILTIDEDRHVASPGSVFIVPRKAPMGLMNTGDKPFVALVIEVPPADAKDVSSPKPK